jgi:hypothetical protein
MTKRKRTEVEQKLYDQIESKKEQRRAVVVLRDAALAVLDLLGHDAPDEAVLTRAREYISRRSQLVTIDGVIAEMKSAYDAMRVEGDKTGGHS